MDAVWGRETCFACSSDVISNLPVAHVVGLHEVGGHAGVDGQDGDDVADVEVGDEGIGAAQDAVFLGE